MNVRLLVLYCTVLYSTDCLFLHSCFTQTRYVSPISKLPTLHMYCTVLYLVSIYNVINLAFFLAFGGVSKKRKCFNFVHLKDMFLVTAKKVNDHN